jgi:prolyl oligopeptidase
MSNQEALNDKYSWLEDGRSALTRAWLEKEHSTLTEYLGSHPLRERVRSIVRPFLESEATDVPFVAGGRLFYLKRSPGRSQASLIVRDHELAEERTIVDPLQYGSGHFTSLTIWSVERSGKRVAVAVRRDGRDEPTDAFVIDVDTGATSALPSLGPKTCLMPELDSVTYIDNDAGAICSKQLGSQAQQYVCELPVKTSGLYLIALGESLVVIVEPMPGGATRSAWLVNRSTRKMKCLLSDFGHSTVFRAADEELFLLTDWQAPKQRLLVTNIAEEADSVEWRELLPEREHYLHNVFVVGDRLVTTVVRGSDMQFQTFSRLGVLMNGPSVPSGGTISEVRADAITGRIAFGYSSPVQPPTAMLFQRDAATIWHEQIAPVELKKVVTRTLICRSNDGTRVPMSLNYREDLRPSGRGPVMLTAYGGYGVSFTPRYSNRSAIWISTGGIMATANIRGGSEYGNEWHRAGRRQCKQNCFDDYIAAAETLISEGITTRDRLAAVGGSNGGLVVAAAITQRPELFAAAILFGPLCDMLRFHLFPGGRMVGVDEFGSPEVLEERKWLERYSPYHRVTAGTAYPAVLIISGDADTRCDPMHSRKMVARLREATGSGRPVLLDYHPQRGHAALLAVADRIETLANQFCFLFSELGLSLDSACTIVDCERG